MAFAQKIDLVGIAQTGLALRSNGQNGSNSVLEIPGADGSVLGAEIFGHIKAPTCEYALSADCSLSVQLGKVYSSAGAYALSRVHVSTGAGQEPVVTADAVQIEPGATRSICLYGTSQLSLSPARHALTFGAFSYTESLSCTLQTSEYDATAQVQPSTINGDPVASDSTGGRETVNVTMWSSSESSAPTVTLGTGWTQTADWTCTGADSSMFNWTAAFTRYLSADMAE